MKFYVKLATSFICTFGYMLLFACDWKTAIGVLDVHVAIELERTWR